MPHKCRTLVRSVGTSNQCVIFLLLRPAIKREARKISTCVHLTHITRTEISAATRKVSAHTTQEEEDKRHADKIGFCCVLPGPVRGGWAYLHLSRLSGEVVITFSRPHLHTHTCRPLREAGMELAAAIAYWKEHMYDAESLKIAA